MLPVELHEAICKGLRDKTGFPADILKAEPIGGGSINSSYKIRTSAGSFFIKYNSKERYPKMFQKEAMGLQVLEEADEIRVPEVQFYGSAGRFTFLVLEWIEPGKMTHHFWQDFGWSLARLHQHTNTFFGLGFDNFMGSLEQSNAQHPDWNTFFIQERIIPQVEIALQSGAIPGSVVKQFEQLYSLLPGLLPVEKPALIHGDFWSGNYMVDNEGSACLVDPAVYYGHREADIAMSQLFGGFSQAFYDSYNELYPMEVGWENRLDIYNLYPLLIHVNLFGGGYVRQVAHILDRIVGK